jgi:hypothetical protein
MACSSINEQGPAWSCMCGPAWPRRPLRPHRDRAYSEQAVELYHASCGELVQLRISKRLARLDSQRMRLVKMAYADAMPLDLLRSEQDRVAREIEHAQREMTEAKVAEH